jgi:hypothetical protein
MPDSPLARVRWAVSAIALAATSTVVSFLAILVGLLTANKHLPVYAWVVGVAAALLAGTLTFWQARGADRERTRLQEQVAELQLRVTKPSVKLVAPSDGDGTEVPEMKIQGKVVIKGLPDNAVCSALKERGLQIVPFVRPMKPNWAPAERWYSQNVAIINEENGEFAGSVRIGSVNHGAGEPFLIKLAILPDGFIPKPDLPFDELPSGVPVSNSRTVYRLST